MHIIIQTKQESALVITIGYKDKLGCSIAFIDIFTEYYNRVNRELEFVTLHYSFFKHYNFWKRGEWFLFKLY